MPSLPLSLLLLFQARRQWVWYRSEGYRADRGAGENREEGDKGSEHAAGEKRNSAVCVSMCLHIDTYVDTHINAHIHIQTYIHINTNTHMCMCLSVKRETRVVSMLQVVRRSSGVFVCVGVCI